MLLAWLVHVVGWIGSWYWLFCLVVLFVWSSVSFGAGFGVVLVVLFLVVFLFLFPAVFLFLFSVFFSVSVFFCWLFFMSIFGFSWLGLVWCGLVFSLSIIGTMFLLTCVGG